MKTIFLTITINIFLISGCSSIEKTDPVNEKTNRISDSNINTAKPDFNRNGQTRILPSADTLSVALTLFRKNQQSPVEANEIFVKNDGVRLNIGTVEKGFLYVLYKGSSGNAQVLFPNKSYFDGKNEIEPNKNVVIPNKGWFFFDEKKGTETVFVVYSKNKSSKITSGGAKENLLLLEKSRSEKGNREAFLTDEGDLVRVVELRHE